MVVVHNIFLKSPVRNLDYLLGVLYFLLMTTDVSPDGPLGDTSSIILELLNSKT